MRRESFVGLLLIACNPRPPEAEAPAPKAEASAPQAAPAPDVVHPPDAAPAKSVVAFQSPAKIPGELAPNLELGEAERAAVTATCKELGPIAPLQCDATRPLPDYLLVRLFGQAPSMTGYQWHVLKRIDGRWVRMELPLDSFEDGADAPRWPDIVCAVQTREPKLAPDQGVVRVMHPDLNLDGRDDLLIECRSPEGDHDLRYCLSNRNLCEERVWLRQFWDGKLAIDADVEFRDGWFVRTIRTDTRKQLKGGNLRVEGVTTPDPGR